MTSPSIYRLLPLTLSRPRPSSLQNIDAHNKFATQQLHRKASNCHAGDRFLCRSLEIPYTHSIYNTGIFLPIYGCAIGRSLRLETKFCLAKKDRSCRFIVANSSILTPSLRVFNPKRR